MRFREIEFKGYTLRLCDLPTIYGSCALVNRHWKVMKNKETITTAYTLPKAKEKATRLAMDNLFRKGMEQ